MATFSGSVARAVVGRPLRSDRLGETLLPKRLALPVFCSDPLSSVAYATEQILLVLGLGGLALLYLTPWVALRSWSRCWSIVVASYRQTCHAYPNGGGAYAVSRANLGEDASLVAASALLIDYVLTVAVSVVAGRGRDHERGARAGAARRGAVDRRCRGPAHRREPARGQGVGPRIRDPDLRVRRCRSSRCSPSASPRSLFGDGHHRRERRLRAASRRARPAGC